MATQARKIKAKAFAKSATKAKKAVVKRSGTKRKPTQPPYNVFQVPKKSGGFRTIEAPNDVLKSKQRALLPFLHQNMRVSPFAHGFAPGKSVATHATHHCASKWVLAMDISDFFPSVTRTTAWSTLVFKGDSRKRDKVWADNQMEIHFHDFGDGKGLRLPQGAPASPLIANAVLYKFDWSFSAYCTQRGCCYTRYADDLVISSKTAPESVAWQLAAMAESMLKKYGMAINRKKTQLMHDKRRQVVCGLVVNALADGRQELPRPKKRWRKRLRAALHQQGQNPDRRTVGMQSFDHMVREHYWKGATALEFMSMKQTLIGLSRGS